MGSVSPRRPPAPRAWDPALPLPIGAQRALPAAVLRVLRINVRVFRRCLLRPASHQPVIITPRWLCLVPAPRRWRRGAKPWPRRRRGPLGRVWLVEARLFPDGPKVAPAEAAVLPHPRLRGVPGGGRARWLRAPVLPPGLALPASPVPAGGIRKPSPRPPHGALRRGGPPCGVPAASPSSVDQAGVWVQKSPGPWWPRSHGFWPLTVPSCVQIQDERIQPVDSVQGGSRSSFLRGKQSTV